MNFKKIAICVLFLLSSFAVQAQRYVAGYTSIELIDSSRIYFPDSIPKTSPYRPVALDIFYPATKENSQQVRFWDLLESFERRANLFQNKNDYTGMAREYLNHIAAENNLSDTVLRKLKTDAYLNAEFSPGHFPIIVYMAGFNGMAFENYKLLETFASSGFLVVSINSIGRYPGDMTTRKADGLEQVLDAEYALKYIKKQTRFNATSDNTCIIGYSWGGVASALFAERNPIAAMISLDGSETYYYGSSTEDDQNASAIFAQLLPANHANLSYLFIESGDRVTNHHPTGEYHYFKSAQAKQKHYLRFGESKHEDFSALVSLRPDPIRTKIHHEIIATCTTFVKSVVRNNHNFELFLEKYQKNNKVSLTPWQIDYRIENTVITGQVVDGKTGKCLPFASVGIASKEIGTVSNDSGAFKLVTRADMIDDTLQISMIGYHSRRITVKSMALRKMNIIELTEADHQLNEVTITTTRLKQKTIGNKTTSKFVSTPFRYDQLGAEVGIKINIRHRPMHLDAFNFHVAHNRLSSKAWFRLNVYTIENGKPAQNILSQNIMIPVNARQTGMISIDLKPYNITLVDDVIIATLEWVKNEGQINKGEAIYFSLGMLNSGTILKKSSQGKFKKYSSMGIGMNFDVRY
jgi:pimeloyl-ACP methyl ester carboxylesterase